MSEFVTESHPIAAEMQFVADTLLLGAGEEIPYWGLLKGVEVEYIHADNTSDGTSCLTMKQGDWKVVEYQFKPASDIANPLSVLEEDEGEITVRPVQARLFVTVTKPPLITIGVRDGSPLNANTVQVDVLDNGMVFSVNESLRLGPILGSYDGDVYKFISRKTYEDLRLGHVVQFVRDFVA